MLSIWICFKLFFHGAVSSYFGLVSRFSRFFRKPSKPLLTFPTLNSNTTIPWTIKTFAMESTHRRCQGIQNKYQFRNKWRTIYLGYVTTGESMRQILNILSDLCSSFQTNLSGVHRIFKRFSNHMILINTKLRIIGWIYRNSDLFAEIKAKR